MGKKIFAALLMVFLMSSLEGCLTTEGGILNSCCPPGFVTVATPAETAPVPRVS